VGVGVGGTTVYPIQKVLSPAPVTGLPTWPSQVKFVTGQLLKASGEQILVRAKSVHLSIHDPVTGSPWLVYQAAAHMAHWLPFEAVLLMPVTGSTQSTGELPAQSAIAVA